MSDPHTSDGDPRLPALLQWRQQLIASGAVSSSTFKEAHVRLVLRSGRRDVEEIRAMLPGSVAEHAEDMARFLDELTTDTTEPGPPADETGAAQAGAAQDVVEPAETPPPEDATLLREAFAPYVFREQTSEPETVALRSVPDPGTGQQAVEIIWPPYQPGDAEPDSFVVYRVVSAEQHKPYSPDRAQFVGATTTASMRDTQPPTSTVRRYQVWVNIGRSLAEAIAAQPVLHAEGTRPSPVQNLAVGEDSGRVVGQWTVFPGASAVHIYRIPAEDAAGNELQYRIFTGSDNLGGFVDPDAEPGRRYIYRTRCEVVVDGAVRLSEAAQAEVRVFAVLAPVDDLSLIPQDPDSTVWDLAWSAPKAGQVLVFRTPEGPSAGAEAAELPETALEQAGLRADTRLTHPISESLDSDGRRRSVIAGVPWPSGWSRAYFTPVTVLAGRARLGKTISTVRAGAITDAQLIEYCTKQVLTFAWPEGAAAVSIHLAPKGHDPRMGLSGRFFEIAFEDYHKFGGRQFVNNELPCGGCSLHLAPVAFSAGRRIAGPITTIEYAGLLRLWYSVQIDRDRGGHPLRASLTIRAERDVIGSPPFVLINNPDRIPLSINDGEPVDVAPLNDRGELAEQPAKEFYWSALRADGSSEAWVANVQGRQGWIRLFAALEAHRLRQLALLDPPVGALLLGRTQR
jgi:hypothetical protein